MSGETLNPSRKANKRDCIVWIATTCGVLCIVLGILVAFPAISKVRHDTYGFSILNYASLGSYLQGASASLFTLGTLLFICATFRAQYRQIEQQDQQQQDQRNQFEAQLRLQEEGLKHQKAQFEAQQKNIAIQQQKKINAILQAMRNELIVVGQYYALTSGGNLDKLEDGKPYTTYFSLTEKYFIVYPNNTQIVGQIDDAELCKSIVVTYNQANFLIESYRINNWYLDKLVKLSENPMKDNGKALKNLTDFAATLKQANAALKKSTDDLLAKIDAYLKVNRLEP